MCSYSSWPTGLRDGSSWKLMNSPQDMHLRREMQKGEIRWQVKNSVTMSRVYFSLELRTEGHRSRCPSWGPCCRVEVEHQQDLFSQPWSPPSWCSKETSPNQLGLGIIMYLHKTTPPPPAPAVPPRPARCCDSLQMPPQWLGSYLRWFQELLAPFPESLKNLLLS